MHFFSPILRPLFSFTRSLRRCNMTRSIPDFSWIPNLYLEVDEIYKICSVIGSPTTESWADGLKNLQGTSTKVNDQYLTNVLLKINAKLGEMNSLLGVEHSPSIPIISKAPSLILGMDVSHGSPRSFNEDAWKEEYLISDQR